MVILGPGSEAAFRERLLRLVSTTAVLSIPTLPATTMTVTRGLRLLLRVKETLGMAGGVDVILKTKIYCSVFK